MRASRYIRNIHFACRLYELYILLSCWRQFIVRANGGEVAFPARKLLQHRLCAIQAGCNGEVFRYRAVSELVGDTDRNFIQITEHIEIRERHLSRPLNSQPVTVATASNQPMRRGLPVTTPNSPASPPLLRSSSALGPAISLMKGPAPTQLE